MSSFGVHDWPLTVVPNSGSRPNVRVRVGPLEGTVRSESGRTTKRPDGTAGSLPRASAIRQADGATSAAALARTIRLGTGRLSLTESNACSGRTGGVSSSVYDPQVWAPRSARIDGSSRRTAICVGRRQLSCPPDNLIVANHCVVRLDCSRVRDRAGCAAYFDLHRVGSQNARG